MSLGSLNAETAPVQGGFFSSIKNYFKKAKTSHEVGKGMKRRDEVAEQMTAEHEAEQDEIASVMRAQGYSDEEIQAQQMFQRVNMSARRADPVNSATADFQDLSMGLDSPAEMDNTFARMGRGTLTREARERQQQRLDHFNRNVLANSDEDQQAEQMAASLGASRVAQGESVKKYNMLSSINGGMRDDNAFKNNNFHSAVERYNASEAGKANPYEVVRGDSKRQRFLERHMTGTEEENDALFQDVMARGDEAMIPKLKEDVARMMSTDMGGFETDEVGNLLSEDTLFSNPQRALDTMNLNKDMHNLFDLMKAGRITPEQLGVGAEGGPSMEDFSKQRHAFVMGSTGITKKVGGRADRLEGIGQDIISGVGSEGSVNLENSRTRAQDRAALKAVQAQTAAFDASPLPTISPAAGPNVGPTPKSGPALRANDVPASAVPKLVTPTAGGKNSGFLDKLKFWKSRG